MNPQEKAQKLFQKFNTNISFEPKIYNHRLHMDNAKQCAIIAVDEILNIEELIDWDFWSDVKQEIQKI